MRPGASAVRMAPARWRKPARKWWLDLSPITEQRVTSMPWSRKISASIVWNGLLAWNGEMG